MDASKRAGASRVDLNLELMLGRLYLQAGDYDKAMVSLRQVVEDQPAYPKPRCSSRPLRKRQVYGTRLSAPSSWRWNRIRSSSAAMSGSLNCYQQQRRFGRRRCLRAGAGGEHRADLGAAAPPR